ncbi:active breakpoint cluster region-related protein isoform X1 [Dicentrarchus labrax]|uniref:Si:dkey-33c9.6 n=1 Tax=Dicentrarchus labrax TaxID=13489 RepID=A0A8P4G7B6_DICLA|nr:active breakpoint cluster region-related protein isoform X1 [Dicentrarchus labrax]XP_051284798.1 active breakpoint cluster region-related protein isoform X1 [Dicentrarchus labrax]
MMDVYQEAVNYLETEHVPVVVEAEADVLEEDVFQEEAVSCYLSPLHSESLDFPDTPTSCSPEEMLERRLVVLKGILESEEVYLRELEALLMPMKALRASAGTSQPVLSSCQVQTVFYQVPELRDLHQSFYSGLKARLSAQCQTESSTGGERETSHTGFELMVGDLFLKMVNQIGLYGGFIGNYEKAVEVVHKCTQSDPRFRTLAESMMSNNNGSDKTRTTYTFEALLYKPLDRVTKTTLVLRDVLKTTPVEHGDYSSLQEALRLSRSFLSGVNESSQSKREVTLSHGMRRQLMRDGFVVDASEGERSLRHLFLYTDLLLCTRFKHASRGKHDQYRFCWYLPLAGLKLRWVTEQERSDTQIRVHTMRAKMYFLRQQIQQHKAKGSKAMAALAARHRKKLEQMELMLMVHSPVYRLDLHSPSGKTHSFLLSSLYELEEWREAIHKLTTDNIETVPPDLLTLTCACGKLRMTQQPPLHSSNPVEDEESLCGTLTVAIHSACGLQQPACVYVCVEVDGNAFYEKQTQTRSSVHSLNPHWDQELSLQVDGAQNLRVLCVSQSDGQDDTVLGKASVTLDSKTLNKRWRRQTLHLGQVEVTLSLKYSHHPLDPPSSMAQQQQPVFCVPIGTAAQQEGVLVPHVVRCCVEEVERRGMNEVGIYRVSGTASDIGVLKTVFNSNLREAVTRLRSVEINAVSGVLKLYFRELPEPLIPTELFQSLARTLDIQDINARLVSMLSLLQSCPDPNRHTFLYILHHLQRVSEKQDINKMSLMNLATVFGPSLLRPPVVGLGHDGPTVDISQEVVVQVQVVFWYLKCNNLPEAETSLQHATDAEDETTHM